MSHSPFDFSNSIKSPPEPVLDFVRTLTLSGFILSISMTFVPIKCLVDVTTFSMLLFSIGEIGFFICIVLVQTEYAPISIAIIKNSSIPYDALITVRFLSHCCLVVFQTASLDKDPPRRAQMASLLWHRRGWPTHSGAGGAPLDSLHRLCGTAGRTTVSWFQSHLTHLVILVVKDNHFAFTFAPRDHFRNLELTIRNVACLSRSRIEQEQFSLVLKKSIAT